MNKQKAINARRIRRKHHIRKRVFGDASAPRLSVFRSNKHIYSQLTDDINGTTVASASTFAKEVRGALGDGATGNKKAAVEVGKLIARRAVGARRVAERSSQQVGILLYYLTRRGYCVYAARLCGL